MVRAKKALILLVVSTIGLWGCARGPVSGSGSPERIRSLESKVSKLEEDFRAAAAARDQLRNQLAAVEEQRALLEKERDDLRQQVVTRTTERDSLQVQYEQFRKNLRSLLGQAETAANKVIQPVTVSADVTASGKS